MIKNKETPVDLFSHELVPKHILLTKDEVEELLRTYKIKPYQLPRIKESDPAARALNAKPGDIVKIVRRSPTAGQAEYYRYVTEEK